MYDRILVPVDGAPAGNPAVERAAELAVRHDAELVGLHVVQTDRIASVPMESAWPGVVTIARDEGETIVTEFQALAEDAGVDVATVLCEGSPSREIVRVGTERECDLIVMATSGRMGLDRILLGSVTERVVRQSPVPVLTIQRPAEAAPEESAVDANAPG